MVEPGNVHDIRSSPRFGASPLRERPEADSPRRRGGWGMRTRFKIALVLLVLLAIGAAILAVRYYPYVFARTVKGQVVEVARVNQNEMILSGGQQIPPSQIFSFAVAIKDAGGEIVTASSEDRQWAVVPTGKCAEAKFLRYPFWKLDKAGTYFGARLLRLYDCASP